jgi:hypothetical protein
MIHLSIPDLGLTALILLLILLCLLLVPIDLEGRVSVGGDRPETRIKIGWLFGRLHRGVFTSSGEEGSEEGDGEEEMVSRGVDEEGFEEEGEGGEEGGEEEGEEEGEEGEGQSPSRVALQLLRTEGFLGNLARLLRGLLGTLQVRTLSIDMMIGLSDPAETGEAVGLLAAALAPLEALAPVRARIVPNFAEEVVAGSAEGMIRIVPIRIVPPFARFLISPPTWRAGWRAASAWRGKR